MSDAGHDHWFARYRRKLLLTLIVITLVAAGVAIWSLQRGFPHEVHAIGGRYRREVLDTWVQILFSQLNGRGPTVFHWIQLRNSEADDDWLHRHRDEIADLSHLILYMSDTNITGQGLSALREMDNIQYLDLSNTQLTDDDVSHIATLPNVTTLYIGGTGISDSALVELSAMPHLVWLGLDSSQATPHGLSELSKCKNLTGLHVENANDDSIANVAATAWPVYMNVDGSQLTAESLASLAKMSGLKLLTLYDSRFSDAELQELRQALPGCTIQQMEKRAVEEEMEASWD